MTLAPTISLKVLNILSIGAAINLSYGTFELDRPMSQRNPLNSNQYLWGQYSETSSGFGFSGTIGALVKLSSDLSFGATYRTANSIAFEGTASHGILIGLLQANYKDADISREVTWPTWMGAGIAYKPVPGLTLALDAQYSQWSIMDSVETTYKNWEMVGLTKNFMVLKWEDAIQIRFGAEYELLKTVAVRAGFYLDPAPAPDATLNILFPSISYKALTCGASLKLPFIEVEAGLEYLMGTERDNTSSYNAVEGGMPGLHNNNILAFSIGLVLNL
jgi:long-chain fatty acid transport protein